MKKLMTMIAAVATAFGLFADEPTTYNGTSFETGEGGVTELKWTPASGVPADAWTTTIEDDLDLGAYTTDDPAYVYASGEGATNTRRNDQFVNGDQNLNYLKLDTGSATVDREVATAQVFYDQVIKFTGFEDMQTNFVGGTKIALWTSAIEDDEETTGEGQNEADTNLYVAVGTGAVANPMKNVKVAVPANFDFNAWHRVTIKNAGPVSGNYLGFFVWIDGVMAQVVEEDKGYFTGDEVTGFPSYYAKGQLFISMNDDSTTVENIGFQGVGSLDDVVVSEENDGPAFAVLTVPVTVLPVDGAEIESVTADGEAVTADKGVYNVTPGAQVVITFAPVGSKMFKNGNKITKKIEDAITIIPADEGIETADIIAKVIVDGGTPLEYYDFAKALADIQTAEATAEEIDVEIVKAITDATFGNNVISLAAEAAIEIYPSEGSWVITGENTKLVADIADGKEVSVEGGLTYGGIVAGTLTADTLAADTLAVADGKTISLAVGGKIITTTADLEDTIGHPTGFKVVASEPDEDDYITYTLEEIKVEYVAEINGKQYETLAAAFEEAVDNDEIELLKDVALDEQINVMGKAVTLAGEYTVSAANGKAFFVGKGGSLTIAAGTTVDGSGNNTTILVVPFETHECKGDYGKATLVVNGTVTYTGNGGFAAITTTGNDNASEGAEIVINGTVTNTKDAALYLPGKGTCTVNTGAYIEGIFAGIQMKACALTVNGGTIKCTGVDATPTETWGNGANASGAAIQMECHSSYAAGSVTIAGGTIESVNGYALYAYGNDATKFNGWTITGGTIKGNADKAAVLYIDALKDKIEGKSVTADSTAEFSSDVSALCVAGYETVKDEGTGLYKVAAIPQFDVTFTKDGAPIQYSTKTVYRDYELTQADVPTITDDGAWDVNPTNAVITCNTNFNFTVKKAEEPVVDPADAEKGEIVISGETATITLKGDATEIRINNGLDLNEVQVPVQLKQIRGVKADAIKVVAQGEDITEAFTKTGDGSTGYVQLELNPAASVTLKNGTEVAVTPTIGENVEASEVDITAGEIAVQAIPGLTYELIRSTKLGDKSTEALADSAKAETAKVELTDKIEGEKPAAAFYQIKVEAK